MIQFEKFTLENGLTVIVHQDKSTPIVAINTLFDVGAKDENPNQTGFAHLFEHLMFGGSVNIPNFDSPLQAVGGESNAFTSNDITNYYITLPKENIETGFWLESDRMKSLAFTPKSLEVQRSVVIEEFKQRYLNQPYGDLWLEFRPLCYKKHPYRWATIGKEIAHIEEAKMEDVRAFFNKHYSPQNAILVVAGDVTVNEIKTLTQKWYSDIPKGDKYIRNIEKEPIQTAPRFLKLKRNVPISSIYKAWHMCDRFDSDYATTDLLSDILSNGSSSRLYQTLVKERKMFSEINAYIMGSTDSGLFVISGKPLETISMKEADEAILNEIEKLKHELIHETELQKVKNKYISSHEFGQLSVLNKAMSLAQYELYGNAEMVNEEIEKYERITSADVQRVANSLFTNNNCNTLHYLSEN